MPTPSLAATATVPGSAAGSAATRPEGQRQKALLKTAALQSAILNSPNFSIIATDEKGSIQLFNTGAERMLGYAAADMVNLLTPTHISDPLEVIARAVVLSRELGITVAPGFEALVFKAARGIEDMYELTYIRKDGSRFPATVSVTALRDRQRGIIGYLLAGTDNSARKPVQAPVLAVAPQPEADPAHLMLAPQAPVPDDSASRTLLYVEDNPANLQLVAQIIARRPDLRLLSARDGAAGMALARTAQPDLILMDINMPGVNGIQAMQLLRADAATAHIPVVALSANAIPRDIARGLEAGFFRYLTKPIKVTEFLETLDVALEFAEKKSRTTSKG